MGFTTTMKMGFYTKIIAFVMCNVTNLSTKLSVVKVACQMGCARGKVVRAVFVRFARIYAQREIRTLHRARQKIHEKALKFFTN